MHPAVSGLGLLSHLMAAAITPDGWRPGIGDPTPLGWFTVAAYVAAGCVCLGMALRSGKAGFDRYTVFWWGVTLLLFLLAVNKQLDLQSFFTQTGKQIAKADGWYEQRRTVQTLFLVGLSVFFSATLALFAWLLRGGLGRHLPVLLGLAWLCMFILFRATSFHRMDALIGMGTSLLRMNHVLELGGISLVMTGTWFAGRSRHLYPRRNR
jgi:hypothetical protein